MSVFTWLFNTAVGCEAVVGVGDDEIANLETYVDVSPYVLEAPFYYRTVKYPSPGIIKKLEETDPGQPSQ